jgi:hypothetical protein
MEAPRWVSLCEKSKLPEQLSGEADRDSTEQARLLYDNFGPQLYTLLWQPLEEELEGVRRVYYSPSGLLHKISFNAIPAGNGNRLADKYDLKLQKGD